MKKVLAPAALSVAILLAGVALASSDKHVKANLESVDGSGVTGFVQITQLPKGGSVINVNVKGLEPNSTYTSFYYESSDCSAPADSLETFTSDDDGNGHVNGKSDEDLDEIGSVSVRLGSGYGTLLACAAIHEED
jgi:hypothetical protein